jgi:hypothetical protein
MKCLRCSALFEGSEGVFCPSCTRTFKKAQLRLSRRMWLSPSEYAYQEYLENRAQLNQDERDRLDQYHRAADSTLRAVGGVS